jgi:hypothetical protein
VFAHGFHFDRLPELDITPPYLDGQYLIYAGASFITDLLIKCHLIGVTVLPTDQSIVIYSIRHTNAISEVGASALIFLSARQLLRSLPVATLTGVLFALSPQMLHIDLLRIDHLILFLLCSVIYFSLSICDSNHNRALGICLGLVLGALICTKITSIAFALPAALAVGHAVRRGNLFTCIACLTAGFTTICLLSFRYLDHASAIASNFAGKVHDVNRWKAVIPTKPYTYYSWEQFSPQGHWFVITCSIAIVIGAYCWIRIPRPDMAVLLISLFVYSALGIPTLKYERGGYHLIPFILLAVVGSARYCTSLFKRKQGPFVNRVLPLSICFLCFLPATSRCLTDYRRNRLDVTRREESVLETRSAPREWMSAHVRAGARIEILVASDWANPPIQDLGYDIRATLFNFPYLDKVKSALFLPPSFRDLESSCDVVLFNDFHKSIFLHFLRDELDLPDVATRWEAFYRDLALRYPPVTFTSPYYNYQMHSVEIYVIHPQVLSSDGNAR